MNEKLSAEEKELLDSYERDEWHSVPSWKEELERYQNYAAATLEARGEISINLPPEDLQAIQRKAAEAGVPYRALIVKIVHQFVNGELIQR